MNRRSAVNVAGMIAVLAFAGPAGAAGWYSGTIEQVEITNTGEVMAFLQAPANHECGTKRVDYLKPDPSSNPSGIDASKSFLATLLSWQAQGKAVRVFIASCDGTTGLITAAVNEP